MKLKLFIIALLAQCVSLTAMAYDAEIDGIYYIFSGIEARVVKGDVPYYGDIVIPQKVTYQDKTYAVTEIGYEAFMRCGISSISIPEGVTTIHSQAFYGCENLTSVIIPNSVTTIDSGAFRYCWRLNEITIPEGVTYIGSSTAFEGTAWLDNQPDGLVYAGKVAYKYIGTMPEDTAIVIKDGTLSITSYAFKDCRGLISITLPESVTSIGYGAFDGTGWFENQPDGLVYLGKIAYKYKGTMPENTTIDIKNGTLIIAEYAFDNNANLLSVTIPEGVTTIGECAFRGCEGLTSVTIPGSVTSIGQDAFGSCYSLPSIVIPEGVKEIASHTFYACLALSSITIPESVTSIGSNAFYACLALSSITIPESVTNIGSYAFENCSGLTSITIPASVICIEADAFSNLNLTSIIVEEGNKVYDSRNNCSAIIETATNTLIVGCKNTIIPDGITSIGNSAFSGCGGLASISIPTSVTSIGNSAFYQCGLTSLNIPASVTSIGDYTFHGCENLSYIVVAKGNKVYDSRNDCNALIETATNTLIKGCGNTIIPEGVTSIANYAFENCSGLTSIIIPEGVTTIGDWAFSGCRDLTSIVIPTSLTTIGLGTFSGTEWLENQPDGLIYAGKVAYCYKGAMKENTSIAIKEGTLGIASAAFSGCENMTSISIPQSVTSIGEGAFYDCKGLVSIHLPEGIRGIGNGTFEYCSQLTSISIPENVTSIGSSAFRYCKSLTSITIPNGVSSIGDYAFYGCESITTILIPESITVIGTDAFDTRSNLSVVKVNMNTPIAISLLVFWGRSGATLYVPHKCKAAYEAADIWKEFHEIVECDYVEGEEPIIAVGGSNTVEIGLNNFDSDLVAFQMDLTLPEGISLDKTGCSLSSRITDEEQELTIGKLENGAYRLTSSSLSLTPISGTQGTLLTLKLTATEDCDDGQATISNIRFSTAGSKRVDMPDETFDIDILHKFKLTYKLEDEVYKTSDVIETTPLTLEAEPTKDGYTFGGWSELPETMPGKDVEITGRFYLYGDVNTDEEVDVVDVVDIARFVVATPSDKFREQLADLNKDNSVNLGDAVVLVNHIAGDVNFVKAMAAPNDMIENGDALSLIKTSKTLALNLTNRRAYTAFQFDLYVDDEANVTRMALSAQRNQEHQLLYNKVENGHYRVAVLSTSNRTFNGNDGELLSFIMDAEPSADTEIRNIRFFDTKGNAYAFDAIGIGLETGLKVMQDAASKAQGVIYDLQGRKLTKAQRGVNIVNGKTLIIKK